MPKPVKKKKKFIRKKEATTYRLIPGYVEDIDDDDNENSHLSKDEIETRKEEQRKHGIFYDDSYNYMKHMRSLNEQASLVSVESFRVELDDEARSLRSGPSVFKEFFSSDVKEEEGLDQEILEALDDAPVVKFENEDDIEIGAGTDDFLDDDFITKAGGILPISHDKEDEDDRANDFISDEEEDEVDEDTFEEHSDDDADSEEYDENQDRLSSFQPVQGRGTIQDDIAEAQTALILKNFEEGLGFRCSNQFSDEEGELPTAEDYENLKHILKQDKIMEKPVSWSEVLDDKLQKIKIDTSRYLYDDKEEYEWREVPPSKPKFDCVSILSLNSNTRNRPTDILPPPSKNQWLYAPLRAERTGDDEELYNQGKKKRQKSEESTTAGLTIQQVNEEMRMSHMADRACTFRPKDETVDEKKSRKKAIKDERRERRQEKKANKEVFAIEKEKMHKEVAVLAKAVKCVKMT